LGDRDGGAQGAATARVEPIVPQTAVVIEEDSDYAPDSDPGPGRPPAVSQVRLKPFRGPDVESVLSFQSPAPESSKSEIARSRAGYVASMSRKTDRELVEAAQKGDPDAFGVIVRRYQKRIYRLAVHLLRDAAEAEDVTQDAFVRAYAALGRFDGRSEPFTWMYRITINLSLNAIRSRKTRQKVSVGDDPRLDGIDHEPLDAARTPAELAADRELATALCRGMDALSETLRTTLILVCIDGLSHAEAGEVLGCPEGTVAWRVHEARKKLKQHLESTGYGAAPVEAESRANDAR
jgi:RNA polymerase sigma-70 factor, ECF subfamily